jgi:hypothetical protein
MVLGGQGLAQELRDCGIETVAPTRFGLEVAPDAGDKTLGTIIVDAPGHGFAVVPIPDVSGLPTPPTSGSVRITAGFGFLGWFLSQRSNGLIFSTLGLDTNGAILLPPGFAP